jgi:hypothetical protein
MERMWKEAFTVSFMETEEIENCTGIRQPLYVSKFESK